MDGARRDMDRGMVSHDGFKARWVDCLYIYCTVPACSCFIGVALFECLMHL